MVGESHCVQHGSYQPHLLKDSAWEHREWSASRQWVLSRHSGVLTEDNHERNILIMADSNPADI